MSDGTKIPASLRRYLGRDERVIVDTRQHPFAIVAAFATAVSWLIPLWMIMWGMYGIEWLGDSVQNVLLYVILVAMIVVVSRLFWSVLGWELARFVLSTEKIIHVHGILHRDIASIPLVKVSDLTVRQPLFGRIFGYGSLVVDSPGGHKQPLHGLRFIPDPIAMYRTISEISQNRRAFEGGANVDELDWTDVIHGASDDSAPAERTDDAPTNVIPADFRSKKRDSEPENPPNPR